MKRWFNSYTVLSVLLSVSVLGVFYDSHAAGGDPAAAAADPATGVFASIGLTDAQKAQVKDILSKYGPTLQPLVGQFRAQRRELHKLTHATPVDEAAIRAQAEKVATIGADLAVERAHLIQEVRGVLTPDQIQKLAEVKDDLVNAKIDRLLLSPAGSGRRG